MDTAAADAYLEAITAEIVSELIAEERTFAATVKQGDTVAWTEWVWERGITGNKADPEDSARVTFTGTVSIVDHVSGTLTVDAATVTPSAAEVRQRPRCRLSIGSFGFVRTQEPA